MALEKGIDKLVQEFIAAGRPSSRKQSIDDRRSGYVASTALQKRVSRLKRLFLRI